MFVFLLCIYALIEELGKHILLNILRVVRCVLLLCVAAIKRSIRETTSANLAERRAAGFCFTGALDGFGLQKAPQHF